MNEQDKKSVIYLVQCKISQLEYEVPRLRRSGEYVPGGAISKIAETRALELDKMRALLASLDGK